VFREVGVPPSPTVSAPTKQISWLSSWLGAEPANIAHGGYRALRWGEYVRESAAPPLGRDVALGSGRSE
jgi:hypothetical protein